MTLVGVEIGTRLKKSGSESHRLFVRNPGVFDVEIKVNLLRAAVRPVRRDVVRGELHAHPPLAIRVNNAMPTLVHEDAATKDPGPERAFRMKVRCVEHDDLTHHSHDPIVQIGTDCSLSVPSPRGAKGIAHLHPARRTGHLGLPSGWPFPQRTLMPLVHRLGA